PTYKTHRVAEDGDGSAEEVPDTLSPQVDMILEVLEAVGIATGGAVGLEADDVLGTLAARETSDPVIVVSGDRDLLQVA
ncbi:flap endonuclease, partial [Mycobacterium kansasii]